MLHNRYLIPGGEDQSTAAEVQLLRDHGCEVDLLEEDNRRIEKIGKLGTAARTLWSRESYVRISSMLRNGGFDVLHVQNFFPLWSPSVYYAAAKHGVPVVQTLRNYRLLCVNSVLFRDGHICEDCVGRAVPWPGVLHGCYRDSRSGSAVVASMIGLHKLLGSWQKQVQVFVALTELAREKFIAGGLPAEKITIKPNFVYPTPPAGEGGGGYALYAGRLSPEKGVHTLLRTWTSAAAALPLRVVGDGPLTADVQEAARSCPNLEYLGRRSPEEIAELMRRADFLVFPSECYEGMPRSIVEALAAGTPVLVSSIGGGGGMIDHARTGFHFAAGNSDELRTLVERCSRQREALQPLRRNARAEFEQKYTGARNVQMLLEIYRRAREEQQRGAARA